jgi:hypothetical protein
LFLVISQLRLVVTSNLLEKMAATLVVVLMELVVPLEVARFLDYTLGHSLILAQYL